jgi:peptidyl-prolyl cis-trans isomerase C
MKLKLILTAALIAGVISAQAVNSGATNAAPATDDMTKLFGDPVIVKAKGFEIKRSELDGVVSGIKARAAAENQNLPADFEVSMLNQLITIQLLLQKATAADKLAGQHEADVEFTNVLERFGSPEAMQRQLKIAGMTEADLRGKAAQEATAKEALKHVLNLSISDAQVLSYYSNHAAAFEEPEKVHVRHVLLMTMDTTTRMPLSTNVVAAKRKQIEDIQKRAAAGEDFAALAAKYSEDPGSKDAGGDLPKFGKGDMVPEFEAAAFSLKPGQVSDVVTTMYGYHVIKAIDRSPAKKYGLTDLIPTVDKTPAAICKIQLESEQIRDKAPAVVQKLRTEAGVEIVDPNLKMLSQIMMDAATNSPAPAGGANP